MNESKGYKDLEYYTKSRVFRGDLSDHTKKITSDEKSLLISQHKRSSRSVTATKANGRFADTCTGNFFILQRASATKKMEYSPKPFDEKYRTDEKFKKANQIGKICSILMNGSISRPDKSMENSINIIRQIPNS